MHSPQTLQAYGLLRSFRAGKAAALYVSGPNHHGADKSVRPEDRTCDGLTPFARSQKSERNSISRRFNGTPPSQGATHELSKFFPDSRLRRG